ncbi:MAG TPA: NlpC/P60 family protein [Acidimicrobiales bacterium]|nr:NlpC/P60 family protein [Acidimicrobiales bacterium]
MSFDPTATIGAVHAATAGLSDLGAQLATAAPSGQFAAVLAQVNSDMAAINTGAVPPAPTPVTSPGGAALSTTALLDTGTAAPLQASAVADAPVYAAGQPVYAAGVPGEAVVTDAQRYLGVPYQWGGTDPATGLDCSGLVQRVYSDLGVQLPRTSQEQATAGTPVASLADARPGDLVFFEPGASGPGHVGIYIGNGQMIDAPHTGTVVRVDPVGTPVAIRRILPGPAGSSYGTLTEAGLAGLPPGGASTSPGMDRLGVPPALQPLFAAAGQRYGIDPVLLAAVAKQESGFQPGAVSGAGAQGLMQMMPATAAGLGVSPFDPASAIDGAAQLLSGYLHDYGGSVPMALAAYNAGPGAVSSYGGVPPYPETQGYVASITSMLRQAGPVGVL